MLHAREKTFHAEAFAGKNFSHQIFQGDQVMAEEITCARCGNKRQALGYAPFPNELGQRIGAEICQPCWAEWLARQNMIINHYGLDLMNEDAQTFLFDNMKSFLFGGVAPTAQIDTSKEGTVKW
jgi:Fe-S cluster biosynthesis and repair protein YggX